jgi:hypothetical protein
VQAWISKHERVGADDVSAPTIQETTVMQIACVVVPFERVGTRTGAPQAMIVDGVGKVLSSDNVRRAR